MLYPKMSVMMMRQSDDVEIPISTPTASNTSGTGNGADNGLAAAAGAGESTGLLAGPGKGGKNRPNGGGRPAASTAAAFWGGCLCCRNWSILNICGAAMIVLLAGILLFDETMVGGEKRGIDGPARMVGGGPSSSSPAVVVTTASYADRNGSGSSRAIPMPRGVNIGSWLSLEDYFFAGRESVEVATPTGGRVAACLPPLHVGAQTGPKWHSETDLLGNLSQATAWEEGVGVGNGAHPTERTSAVAHAVQVFQAHRNSFVDLDVDLARLAALGVKSVRVPMSWCLTDSDPRTADLRTMDPAEVAARFTCPDPYFGAEGVRWPAVPKALVVDFLRACSQHGIQAALDVHTYPGGTSIGTFSGVWPRWPRFWTDGDVQSTDLGMVSNPGHALFAELVAWMEDLADTDPVAFDGLRGLSPMNEPAHLAGLFGGAHPSDRNFLPPLPEQLAQEYLEGLAASAHDPSTSTAIPDGTHLRVLYWFKGAVEIFRNSKLPGLGKQLHANIHESIFNAQYLPDGDADWGGRHPGATAIIASWWCSADTTRPEERADWAVLDMHHYHAWEGSCMGAVDGQDGAAYACGDVEARDEVLDRCTQWAPMFRETVDRECGRGARLMSAEFSAATHHSVRRACNDVGTLKESYVRQVEAAEEAEVELFYWSYHMPYGGAFRRAWSFQELMYLLGVLDRPDEPQFGCNDHAADGEEPNDDFFVGGPAP
jgi:hypothetical protein